VTYYHVEVSEHAVILAEGLPVESYLHTGDRANFHGGATIRLFPDFAPRFAPDMATVWETRSAAMLVMAGAELASARCAVLKAAPKRCSRSIIVASGALIGLGDQAAPRARSGGGPAVNVDVFGPPRVRGKRNRDVQQRMTIDPLTVIKLSRKDR
jgi:hypothetical protein